MARNWYDDLGECVQCGYLFDQEKLRKSRYGIGGQQRSFRCIHSPGPLDIETLKKKVIIAGDVLKLLVPDYEWLKVCTKLAPPPPSPRDAAIFIATERHTFENPPSTPRSIYHRYLTSP